MTKKQTLGTIVLAITLTAGGFGVSMINKVPGVQYTLAEYNEITGQNVKEVGAEELVFTITDSWIEKDIDKFIEYIEMKKGIEIREDKTMTKEENDLMITAINLKISQVKSKCLIDSRCTMVEKPETEIKEIIEKTDDSIINYDK